MAKRTRGDDCEGAVSGGDLPEWDGPRFGKWLQKWRRSEGLEWGQISERSGLAKGTLQMLARGTPSTVDRSRGQKGINPGINTVARLAHGLGLDLNYVVSKAGIRIAADRWDNFNMRERAIFERALRDYVGQGVDGDAAVLRLLDELSATVESSNDEAGEPSPARGGGMK